MLEHLNDDDVLTLADMCKDCCPPPPVRAPRLCAPGSARARLNQANLERMQAEADAEAEAQLEQEEEEERRALALAKRRLATKKALKQAVSATLTIKRAGQKAGKKALQVVNEDEEDEEEEEEEENMDEEDESEVITAKMARSTLRR